MPVFAVALALRSNVNHIVFCTHSELRNGFNKFHDSSVEFRWIDEPCLRRAACEQDLKQSAKKARNDASKTASSRPEPVQARLLDLLPYLEDADLIISNLFAMEAFHVAELLDVPYVCVSPYL